MIETILAIAFFIVAVVSMAVALHFAKYKKRADSCCGGGNCQTDENGKPVGQSCYDSKNKFVEDYGKRKIQTDAVSGV
jgi:hypothetical protein